MRFLRRRDEPEIEFIAKDDANLAEYFPPVPARRAVPSWFSKMPMVFDKERIGTNEALTTKACPGIIDHMSRGYVLPLWNDFEFIVQNNIEYEWKTGGTWPGVVQGFASEKAGPNWVGPIIKFNSPWRCRVSPGWSVAFLPILDNSLPFTVIAGAQDCDVLHEVNIIVDWHGRGRSLLKAGTPFVHCIPYRRETPRLKVTNDAKRWEEFNRSIGAATGGIPLTPGAYRMMQKRRDECPIE